MLHGDRLDTLDLSDDLEVHAFPYATKPNARLTLKAERARPASEASGSEDPFKPIVGRSATMAETVDE